MLELAIGAAAKHSFNSEEVERVLIWTGKFNLLVFPVMIFGGDVHLDASVIYDKSLMIFAL